MSNSGCCEAVVVGSGPNGLAAALVLARRGARVLVLEADETIGGGARSAELTRPGFVHDVGSAVHPLAVGSPFFSNLPLEEYGLHWIHPEVPLAHPLEEAPAAVLHRSVERTAAELGGLDDSAYRTLMEPLVRRWEELAEDLLGPILRVPSFPLLMARFARRAIRSAESLSRGWFEGRRARALFAGLAAHAALPLNAWGSSAFGLVLGSAGHAVGWPFPQGGAQRLADALAAHLRALDGEVITGRRIDRLEELPECRAVLLDVTPRQLLHIAGDRLPAGRYRRRLEGWRYGPAVFKVDYALSEPIPWSDPACRRAGTVHVGGSLEEIARAEQTVAEGEPPDHPFVLLAQHSRFDPTRAPEGKHTAWAYCHVPLGAGSDMSRRIERQIERFAPGFRDCILERHTSAPADLQRMNPNLIEGDIYGGSQDLPQLLARPVLRLTPYRTPLPRHYLCSASTPPGGGVHGMCGYHAARVALRDGSLSRP